MNEIGNSNQFSQVCTCVIDIDVMCLLMVEPVFLFWRFLLIDCGGIMWYLAECDFE